MGIGGLPGSTTFLELMGLLAGISSNLSLKRSPRISSVFFRQKPACSRPALLAEPELYAKDGREVFGAATERRGYRIAHGSSLPTESAEKFNRARGALERDVLRFSVWISLTTLLCPFLTVFLKPEPFATVVAVSHEHRRR